MLPKTAAAIAAAKITRFMSECIIIRPKWISDLECLRNGAVMANHNGQIG